MLAIQWQNGVLPAPLVDAGVWTEPKTLSDDRREGEMSAARVRSNVSTTLLLGIRRKAGYEGGICDAAAVTCVLVPGSVVAAGPEVTIVISQTSIW